MKSIGINVKRIVSNKKQCDISGDIIYCGFKNTPNIQYTHYFWYVPLKVITIFSRKYKSFIDSYADWCTNGRQMGAARALLWLQICGKVREWQPDIIHVHFAWNLPHVIPLARFLNIPIVCTVHGSDIYLRTDWPHHLRNPTVKRIICVSDSMKAFIHGQCPDLAEKTVRVFNPINRTFLQDVVPPPHMMRIIMIATFRTLKNHAWLLRSLRILNDRQIDFECVLVGDAAPWEPEVYDETRYMIDRLDLSKCVILRSWSSAEIVKEEIDQSTVLALTSTSEGFGMVIVESLARHRTPVVTDLPGTRDATKGGRYGILVPLNDVEGLAGSLLKAHEETVRQSPEIRLGREFVLRNFHPDVHLVELQKIYEDAFAT